jgi:hypothetical protein
MPRYTSITKYHKVLRDLYYFDDYDDYYVAFCDVCGSRPRELFSLSSPDISRMPEIRGMNFQLVSLLDSKERGRRGRDSRNI